eukprot:scaffold6345_cov114-Skeletonema_marinoi.AAC.2
MMIGGERMEMEGGRRRIETISHTPLGKNCDPAKWYPIDQECKLSIAVDVAYYGVGCPMYNQRQFQDLAEAQDKQELMCLEGLMWAWLMERRLV